MKGEHNIWKRWWLGLAYFNPVLPLYRNNPNDLLHKSLDWLLHLQIHVLVFIRSSIFHFSLSCLGKNYNLSLEVSKKLLITIYKFSTISVQYAIEGIFYRFYYVIARHCESILLLKCCFLLEKKRLYRFIKPQLLNFPNFQPG